MAWTDPPTKTSASTMSTSDWNTYVRDNLAAVVERPTCSLTLAQVPGSGYSLADKTETILEWHAEEWDSHGLHSLASNLSRITCPTGWGGAWLFCSTISIRGGDPDGYRRVRILKNGSTEYAQNEEMPSSGKARTSVCTFAVVDLTAGDYVELEVYSNAGQDLSLLGDADDDELGCEFSCLYIGETDSNSTSLILEGWSGLSADDPADWWTRNVAGGLVRLRHRPCARALTSGAQSVPADTWTTMTLGSETFDNDSMHSTASNQSRMTATREGYYLCLAQANFASGSDETVRRVRFNLNGTGTQNASTERPSATTTWSVQAMQHVHLDAGDYVEVAVYQGSSGALDCGAWLALIWLGDNDPVSGAQRINDRDWSDDAYAGGAQSGTVPRSWLNVMTRDLPGLAARPPLVTTRAKFARDIQSGEWKRVRWNRQQHDPWSLVKGKRNFGERFVVPVDGVYLTGCVLNIADDQVISARYTVKTTTFTVDTGTDVVTATSHGYRTKNEVTVGNDGGSLPGGLISGSPYFVRRINDNTFTLHETRRDAQNNTNIVNITSAGSGTHRVSNSMINCRGLNLRTGVRVRFATSNTTPLGLTVGIDWYVIRVGPDKFRVALTQEAAEAGEHSVIFDSGNGIHTVTVMEPYGSRGVRLIHSGEVQGGWVGSAGPTFVSGRPALSIVACKAEDELSVEALTTGPEGSRITAENPASRWFAAWCAPFAYTGALPMADRD